MYRVDCPSCGEERKLLHPARGRMCPECGYRRRAQTLTAQHAEVDDMAVERLLSRIPVKSTRAERQTAIQYLTQRGYSARSIAERIGVSQRTVQRLQRRAALEAAA